MDHYGAARLQVEKLQQNPVFEITLRKLQRQDTISTRTICTMRRSQHSSPSKKITLPFVSILKKNRRYRCLRSNNKSIPSLGGSPLVAEIYHLTHRASRMHSCSRSRMSSSKKFSGPISRLLKSWLLLFEAVEPRKLGRAEAGILDMPKRRQQQKLKPPDNVLYFDDDTRTMLGPRFLTIASTHYCGIFNAGQIYISA